MKVIKGNTTQFPKLHESVERIYSDVSEGITKGEYEASPDVFKYSRFLHILSGYRFQLYDIKEIEALVDLLENTLREIFSLERMSLFLFGNDKLRLEPVGRASTVDTEFVNNSLQSGILDWVFENKGPAILPDITNISANSSPENFLVVPVFDSGEPKGILTIATHLNSVSEKSFEIEALNVLLLSTVPRIELLMERENLKRAYSDMQLYQSKLSNDFKLSALKIMIIPNI